MRLRRGQGLLWALGIVILLGLGELALRARYRQLVLPAGGAKPDAVTIVALGDSITAGWPGPPEQAWPARLEARLRAAYPAAAWRVVNAGAPGETAPMGYARFDRSVAAHAPDLTLIAFGLNDCHRYRHALDRWFEARVPVGPERSYLWRALQARVQRISQRLGRTGCAGLRARTDTATVPADDAGGVLRRAGRVDRPHARHREPARPAHHDAHLAAIAGGA